MIMVYRVKGMKALNELLGYLDPNESMETSLVGDEVFHVVYKTPYGMTPATTDEDIVLLFQTGDRQL
jgi:hypothetical protein